MGIYGNLSNTAKTQFQFDKIYPNRLAMDNSVNTDGVYLGRYVLVEYDQDVTSESVGSYYFIDNKYCADATGNIEILYQSFTQVDSSEVDYTNYQNYYVKTGEFYRKIFKYDASEIYYKINPEAETYGVQYGELIQTRKADGELTGKIFKCIGPGFRGEAVFEEVEYSSEENYTRNYDIDIKHYGLRQPTGAYSRAWDSTVWQKVIVGSGSKYICIAELNASAPGLTFVYDAPTETPLAPHYGSSAANNTYEIHIQPSWGMRIKEATNPDYSDSKVNHIISTYNSADDSVSEVIQQKNGDIFFNKAGFRADKSVHEENIHDEIRIEATGRSGVKYHSHLGYLNTMDEEFLEDKQYFVKDADNNYILFNEYEVGEEIPYGLRLYERTPAIATDIQEISVHLPAIGNAVADFYDKVYTPARKRDTNWKYVDEGPDAELGGMTRDQSTLAGSINDFHDTVGMIIKKCDTPMTQTEIDNASSELIYYYPSTASYYRRAETYEYDDAEYIYSVVNTSTEEYYPNCYYYVNSGTTYLDSNNNIIPSVLQKDLGEDNWINGRIYFKKTISSIFYANTDKIMTDYTRNKYYYKRNDDYITESAYEPVDSRSYFKFDKNVLYTQTEDEVYQENKEYYNYTNGDYVLIEDYEIEDEIEGTVYESTSKTFKASYQANTYYYFEPKTIDGTTYDNYYYKVDTQFPYTDDREYYTQLPTLLEETSGALYFTNKYFFSPNDDGRMEAEDILEQLALDINNYPTDGRYYWRVILGDPEWVYDFNNSQWRQVQQIESCARINNIISPSGKFRHVDPETGNVSFIEREAGAYYYQSKTATGNNALIYTKVTELDITNSNVINYDINNFYTISVSADSALKNEDFYCANKYYTFSEGGLIVSRNPEMEEDEKYYQLPKNASTGILNCMTAIMFYKPNKYYYKIGEVYVLDESLNVTAGRQYYNKRQYRVISDMLNQFAAGAPWSTKISLVPCTIEIGKPNVGYELKELVGFKSTVSTVLGQILQMSAMLDENGVLRTENTLQGIVNTSKDLNNRFEQDLEPNRVLITDHIGRITTYNSIAPSNLGNILTDTATGTQYKLKVTNGTLGIEAV